MPTLKPALLVLALLLTGALHAAAQCRDPWVSQAIQQVYGRKPVGQGEACDCNIRLYNSGAWGSYNELVGYVQQLRQSGLQFGYAPLGSNSVLAVAQGKQVLAVAVFDASGNLVASGGGNLVASGGGNLVASGGGNLISQDGGGFTGLTKNTAGFAFGSNYGTLGAGQRRLPTSGKGALVIH
ncbi:hypothetical protein ACFQ48_12940 [Hymenobacter caeli]|uniref:Uncharacterized protein n=1 Tax=Hymenobacter caeli TaxID=2735894 RepID=A0ABX2FTG5_9BACT|nr:hypothetical protein [Hymenobacter caeli]NRT20257.1 hypothetical protein [Hymenobacter caeli]